MIEEAARVAKLKTSENFILVRRVSEDKVVEGSD